MDVLITPERLDSILSLGLSLYRRPDQRAAMRGCLTDAAWLCDALASELIEQYRLEHGKRAPPKRMLDVVWAFRRAGDEIMRMRDRVEVPK